jgi:stearoyl-CoA desaturase (delta-9 desaturase)
MLNVICHLTKQGYKNFSTADDSVNVWWVGILAAGEGWHNNHHAFPGSAKTGLRPHEVDLSWLTIRLGKKLGLVSWVNVPARFARRKVSIKHGSLARLSRQRAIRRERHKVAA